jgi:hypothetical protein
MNAITSFGTSPALDNLRVPDGRRVGDLSHAESYSILGGLGIDGFDHRKGLQDNIQAYASHLEKIASEAGQKAISFWMAEKRNV